jgi:hypothetical protein
MERKHARAILCLSLVLMLALLPMVACGYSTTQPTSTANIELVALQFLGQVAGFNTSNYQIAFSAPSGPNRMPNTEITPHFETSITANVSNGNDQAHVLLTFVDGNFWMYEADSSSTGALGASKQQSFNDSMNTLINVTSGYCALFNESYWSDFAQLAFTALQTQELSVENGDFSLQITQNGSVLWAVCYQKIDGQYESPFRSMQVEISNNGLVDGISDNLNIYYVATTNVTVTEEQAIAIAEPYIQAFAQQNQQQVTAMNATFEYERDGSEERGDSFAVYPEWFVDAWYDKPAGNVTGYGVGYSVAIWADNGEIAAANSVSFIGSSSGNAQPNLPLLLIPALVVIIMLALALGVYFHRKPKGRAGITCRSSC